MLPVILAAETKTPFLIAGGLLALYALVLSAIGLRTPTFPGGSGGMRAVIGLTAVVVVVAIAMAVAA